MSDIFVKDKWVDIYCDIYFQSNTVLRIYSLADNVAFWHSAQLSVAVHY